MHFFIGQAQALHHQLGGELRSEKEKYESEVEALHASSREVSSLSSSSFSVAIFSASFCLAIPCVVVLAPILLNCCSTKLYRDCIEVHR